ncbi:MAG TPA: hypothetical protein VMP01_12625 [Pirellulaceae bacterium]|nr:hypothetical protein [Pirellulaceae bacterium]
MMHFSCDRCKCELDGDDLRYVVKIEIHAAMDPVADEDLEDDRDHLMEIEDILENSLDEASDAIGDDIYQRRRFDLCPECYRKFVQNPLSRELKVSLGFSKN